MRQRLYFLLPDVESARQTANDLLLARIEDKYMHFLGRRGTDLRELHEASVFQKSDIVHGAQLGLVLGGIAGALVGTYVVISPPQGLAIPLATILATLLGGALLGAWIASLVASSVPNTQLTAFQADLEAGKVLLMVDVPYARVDEIQALIRGRHPEAGSKGVEPNLPVFP